ncbi:MAG: hypothetical protein LUF84_05945 [Clostridiales bacterium]|nr:hypothetical protein [Clostridiales bacterium]
MADSEQAMERTDISITVFSKCQKLYRKAVKTQQNAGFVKEMQCVPENRLQGLNRILQFVLF